MEMVKTEGIPPMEAFESDLTRLSEGTQRLYRRWFDNFLTYVNGTPEELIEMITKSENRELALKSIRKTIEKYQDELVEEGLNPNTVKVVSKAVSKFLTANEINDFKMKDTRNGTASKGKLVLLKEQVASLYEDSGKSRRLRALVMAMKDTGLRPSDIVKMTVEDFRNARRIPTDRGEFRAWSEPLLTQKNSVYAYVHLGPESIEAIEDYIGNRTEGAIFRTERRMPTKNGYTEAGEPMKGINVTTCMRTLCKHLKSKGYNVSAASLRKFFITNMSTKFELAHVKILIGKALPPTDQPYLQSALNGELTKLYVKHYEAITIHTDNHIDRELETSKQRIQTLEDELATMREMLTERSQSQERQDQQITIEDIRRHRRIQQLESKYEDTDEGFAKLTKALDEIDEEQ